MIDLGIILIVLAIVVAIIVFLCVSKKKGKTCVGCPYANQCSGKCNNKK